MTLNRQSYLPRVSNITNTHSLSGLVGLDDPVNPAGVDGKTIVCTNHDFRSIEYYWKTHG